MVARKRRFRSSVRGNRCHPLEPREPRIAERARGRQTRLDLDRRQPGLQEQRLQSQSVAETGGDDLRQNERAASLDDRDRLEQDMRAFVTHDVNFQP